MIAQDTGSAIVGPARADLYWGAGDDAERVANRIHHPGHFVMLLPRELDLFVASSETPLPVPKPKIATLEASKQDGKKQDDKGKANSANEGTVGIGRQTPAPEPTPRTAALEAGKQDSKSRAHSAHAGVTANGRQAPASEPTPRIATSEAGKRDSKGKAHSANAGAIAASGEQRMLPARKSVRKHGDAKAEPANGGEDRRVVGRYLAVPRSADY